MSWQRVTSRARHALGGSDARKARLAEAQETHGGSPGLAELITRYAQPGANRLLLGSVRAPGGKHSGIHVPTSEITAERMHVTGASGAGKSMWLLGLIGQLARSRKAPGIVLVDMKGELAGWLTGIWLPLIAERLAPPEREKFLGRIIVINPFAKRYLPELQVLGPDPATSPELQANELLDLFTDTVGELGARMVTVLRKLLLLGISTGLTFPQLARVLASDEARFEVLARTDRADVREYFLTRFAKENQASVQALESRLDSFLALPETRLVLGASGCIDFAALLDGTITIIDLGSPPLGSERTARFWAALILGKLTRAIMAREVSETTRPLWLVADEWQEALVPSQVGVFERLLTQARFKRCGLTLANQGSEQLADTPALRRIVETNIGIRVAFRAGSEDARALAPSLAGRVLPGAESENLRATAEALTRLPDRVFYANMKRRPYGPQFLVSPTLPSPTTLARRAQELSQELRDRVLRGRYGRSREELEEARRGDRQRAGQGENAAQLPPGPEPGDIFGPFLG